MKPRTFAVLTAASLAMATIVYYLAATTPPDQTPDHDRKTEAPNLNQQLADRGLRLGKPIFIRIFKESSELELWMQRSEKFVLFKTYPICNYSGDLGPKLKEGDRQSPEGFYNVSYNQLNPNSSYHLSFNLGFPNAYDRAHGRTGSYLMVHGDCVSIGCYAMTDAGIEEIFSLAKTALKAGQDRFQVHAFPFRMTVENMRKHARSRWLPYWQNLKDGYDAFEAHRIPPRISVSGQRYRIAARP